MSMMGEIEKFMTDTNISTNYRVINLGGRFLYLEGIKSVVSFGVDEMVFQLKHEVLSVIGTDLKIKYLDKTTCVLEGNIRSVGVK